MLFIGSWFYLKYWRMMDASPDKEVAMRFIALLTVVLLLASRSMAADISSRIVMLEGSPSMVFTLRGDIVEADYDRFKVMVDRYGKKNSGLDLDSTGGDVRAAVMIGDMIRDQIMYVHVPNGASCVSACVFILQAGVSRTVYPNATLGLHRPRFPAEAFGSMTQEAARDKYNAMVDTLKGYWLSMGGSDEAFRIMMATPSSSVRVVRADEAATLGLDGADPAWYEYWHARDTAENPFARFIQPR